MIISQPTLNRLITLENYSFSTNDAGGVAPVLAESLTNIWANVKPLNGGNVINQGQDKNFADYQITIRYRPQVNETWTINYNGQTLMIKQMQVDDEAYKRYLTIYASTTIKHQSWS
jgi:SPP1 family predicted phage head-tail adaptor